MMKPPGTGSPFFVSLIRFIPFAPAERLDSSAYVMIVFTIIFLDEEKKGVIPHVFSAISKSGRIEPFLICLKPVVFHKTCQGIRLNDETAGNGQPVFRQSLQCNDSVYYHFLG
jgi:hypothetical protein